MTLDQFIAQFTGVGVDPDNVSGFQCVQLINQYLISVLGITNPIQLLPGPTAIAIWNAFQTNESFQKIVNTPNGVPVPGDIVFWEQNAVQQTGPDGDVAIFVSGNQNAMQCFCQNYPTGSLPHLQQRTYDGRVGWLHPIQSPTGTFVDAATFDQLVTKSTNYDEFVKIGYTNADQVTTKINSLQTTIDNDNTEIGNLTTQVQNLTLAVQQGKDTIASITAEMQKMASSDSTAIDNGTKAEQELASLQSDMETIAQYLGTSPTKQNMLIAIDNLKMQITTSQQTTQKQATNFNAFINEFIKRFIAKK
jgi:hypothetical protein